MGFNNQKVNKSIIFSANTLNYELFSNYLFKFVHTWTVHIFKDEYLAFFELIFNRITNTLRIKADRSEVVYKQTIRVIFHQIKTEDSYRETTWEQCVPEEIENPGYDYPVDPNGDDSELKLKRPALKEGYEIDGIIFNYEEQSFYETEIRKEQPLELIKIVLKSDDEIIAYGYSAQYIISYFRNNAASLINMRENQTLLNDYEFKINGYKPCEQ